MDSMVILILLIKNAIIAILNVLYVFRLGKLNAWVVRLPIFGTIIVLLVVKFAKNLIIMEIQVIEYANNVMRVYSINFFTILENNYYII